MARGFEFELQAVLEHRERVERARQGEVARLEGERMAIEGRLRAIQEAMASGRREVRAALGGAGGAGGGVVRIDAARLAANAALHDVVRLQRGAIELAGLHQQLSAARAHLLRATVARKAVELLRSRRLEAWKRREARREAGELDDLVVMRAGRMEDVA